MRRKVLKFYVASIHILNEQYTVICQVTLTECVDKLNLGFVNINYMSRLCQKRGDCVCGNWLKAIKDGLEFLYDSLERVVLL